MGEPQYVNQPTIDGGVPGTNPSDVNPNGPGIDFTTTDGSITVTFPPGVTPIVTEISVPTTNTNVDKITVVIKSPDGTVIVTEVSPDDSNTVTDFPVTPLPEGSTITVTFHTNDEQPPENVTLSIIACFTPTTVVSTGTTLGTSMTTGTGASGTTETRATGSTASTGTTLILSTTTISTGQTPEPTGQSRTSELTSEVPTSTSKQVTGTGSSPLSSTTSPPTTVVTTPSQSATTGAPTTTTIICPLAEGMGEPLYTNQPTINGAVPNTNPSDVNPNGPGIDFTTTDGSITVTFPPGVTPIVTEVSVPTTNTNVDKITVVVKSPDGTVIVTEVSPRDSNTVTKFPVTQLPDGSTITVTFHTNDEQPPENVTLSIIACYKQIIVGPTVVTTSGQSTTTVPGTTVMPGSSSLGTETTMIISGSSTKPSTSITGVTGTTSSSRISTTTPCYSGDIMYRDNYILSIKDVDSSSLIDPELLRTDTDGVTFVNKQQPTLLIDIDTTLVSRLISIAVPTQDGVTNVNQIQLSFFDANGEVLLNPNGEPWIVETTLGVTKLEQLVPTVPVKSFAIKLLQTTDGSYPRNVTLEIIGCLHPHSTTVGVSTTETRISTESTPTTNIATSPTTTHATVCVKVEAMNPRIGVIDEIFLQPPINVDTQDLIPGRNGVDFPEDALYPNITIQFSRVGRLYFIQIPPESQSNVQTISVEFLDAQKQLIATYVSPLNQPKIDIPSGVDNVAELIIRFVATSDDKSPKNITIDVIGCFFEVVPISTTMISTQTTTEPCLVTDGMSDAAIIPDENIVNEYGVSVGDRARLINGSRGYSPISTTDSINIKLTRDNTQIAIGQIIIDAQNYLSATLSIKTETDNTWKQVATLTKSKTTFTNLFATELRFQFTKYTKFVKLGIIGCFPPPVTTTATVSTTKLSTTPLSSETSTSSAIPITSSGSPYTTSVFTLTTPSCVLSEWGAWSDCSAECTTDRYQTRTRSELSGSGCSEPLEETRPCNQSTCEQCTLTRQVYLEQLDHTPPSDGLVGYVIDASTGAATDTSVYIGDTVDRGTAVFVDNCTKLVCDFDGVKSQKIPCQEDCKYTPWSEWSMCDASCGHNGNRTRRQSLIIDDPSSINPLCVREKIETMPCSGDPCPCTAGINCSCELSKWSEWSSCTKTCGGGQRERSRQYLTNSTEHCLPEHLREVQPCNVDCCPVDGQLSPWSQWSTCSKECGSGVRKRFRSCTAPPSSCKGKFCTGSTVDIEVCNPTPCEPECTNGQIYSECANDCDTTCESLTCDDQCQRPDKCVPGCVCPDGKVIGPNNECIDRKQCKCRLSGDNSTLVNGESNTRDPCKTYTCTDGCIVVQDKNCTQCEWSQWTPFTDCSNACNGTQSRYRTYDGPNCPNKQTEEDKRPCSSNCTVVCYATLSNGTIVSYNVGDIVQETRCNRSICSDMGMINTQPIDGTRVDGQWNLWSSWSECSQTCNGTRKRYRLCAAPAPECDGRICQKLPGTNVEIVTDDNNNTVSAEIQREKCGQLCYSTTTSVPPTTTTPHEECSFMNGTNVVTVPPQTVIPNPTNSCELCICKHGSLRCTPICNETQQTCMEKQAQDPNNRYQWIAPAPGKCCGICNKTQVESKCRVTALPDEYIRIEECVSLTRVGREQCSGGCESRASNVVTMSNRSYKMNNSTCQCCAPKDTYQQTISMACRKVGRDYVIVEAKYSRIRSCDCKVCLG